MGWLGLTGYITFCAGYLRGVGYLGAAGQSYLSLHRQREFSDQRAACTCQAGADWAVGLWPIKAVEHSQADSPLLS